jgi:hypothetical protein
LTDNLEEKALALIKTRTRGVLQSELWKDLEIDSRKCSRVVAKLEAEGKVKRTWETVSGTRTYRLSYVETKKEAPKKEYRFDLIMAEDQVAPCVGCTYECEPDYCPDLGEWIELLAKEAIRKPSKSMPTAEEEEIAPPVREAPRVVEVPAPKVAKKSKARPEPEEEDEDEEEEERPTRVSRKSKPRHDEDEDEDWDEEEEEEEEPVRPARKGKKVVEPEEEEEPVKPAKKGKKAAVPEEKPVKMAKAAAKKGKAAPEPEEEEEEEIKPVKKGKPVKETKAAPKAPEAKPAKKAPAKKR